MNGALAFSGTVVVLVLATCLAWVKRAALLELWAAPCLKATSEPDLGFSVLDPAGHALVTVQVTMATAALLSFPVFAAEAWLVVCRMTGRPEARRLTVPFAVLSGGAALLAFWLVRQVVSSYTVLI